MSGVFGIRTKVNIAPGAGEFPLDCPKCQSTFTATADGAKPAPAVAAKPVAAKPVVVKSVPVVAPNDPPRSSLMDVAFALSPQIHLYEVYGQRCTPSDSPEETGVSQGRCTFPGSAVAADGVVGLDVVVIGGFRAEVCGRVGSGGRSQVGDQHPFRTSPGVDAEACGV